MGGSTRQGPAPPGTSAPNSPDTSGGSEGSTTGLSGKSLAASDASIPGSPLQLSLSNPVRPAAHEAVELAAPALADNTAAASNPRVRNLDLVFMVDPAFSCVTVTAPSRNCAIAAV